MADLARPGLMASTLRVRDGAALTGDFPLGTLSKPTMMVTMLKVGAALTGPSGRFSAGSIYTVYVSILGL